MKYTGGLHRCRFSETAQSVKNTLEVLVLVVVVVHGILQACMCSTQGGAPLFRKRG